MTVPNRGGQRAIWGVLLGGLFVLGWGIWQLGLIEPAEPRFAAIGQEMWRTGDFVTPRFNGFVYLAKPPLLHWLTALAIGLLGPNEAAVRLSALFSAVGVLAFVFLLARYAWGEWEALFSVLVLCSMIMFFGVARMLRYDMPLTLALIATISWAFLAGEERQRARLYYVFAAIAAGLGVLVKGPIAIALPGLILLIYWLLSRQFDAWRRIPWLLCLSVLALLIAPWFVAVERAHPGALRYFLIVEHIGRAAGAIQHQWHPFWFLGAVNFVACFPWTLALVPAWLAAIKGACPKASTTTERLGLLAAIMCLTPAFVFSFSKVKLPTYILPSLPGAAWLIGSYIVRAQPKGSRRWIGANAYLLLGLAGVSLLWGLPMARRVDGALGLLVLLAGSLLLAGGLIALIFWRKYGVEVAALAIAATGIVFYHLIWLGLTRAPEIVSDRPLAEQVAQIKQPGEQIYCALRISRGLVFYLDERIVVIGDRPEEYDFPENESVIAQGVIPPDKARDVLAAKPGLLVCRKRYARRLESEIGDLLRQVGETDNYVILRWRGM